jgi:hypothetical protein
VSLDGVIVRSKRTGHGENGACETPLLVGCLRRVQISDLAMTPNRRASNSVVSRRRASDLTFRT